MAGTGSSRAAAGAAKARQRRERSDKGQVRLNQRDLTVLLWLGEMYTVRMDQLQRLLGRLSDRDTIEAGIIAEATAERVVRRWLADGLVERRKYLYRDPAWVWLTKRGLEQMGMERYRPLEPKVALLNHYYWVNQVRLYIEGRRGKELHWRCERELRQVPNAGKVVQTSEGRHYADAEIELPDTQVALEVELTQKKRERLAEIMGSLARTYPTVWYFTNETTRRAAQETKDNLAEGMSRRILIYDLAQTV